MNSGDHRAGATEPIIGCWPVSLVGQHRLLDGRIDHDEP